MASALTTHFFDSGVAHVIVHVAHIEARRVALPGITLPAFGFDSDFADCGDQAFVCVMANASTVDDPFCRCRERIVAQVHGGCARVVGFAGELKAEPRLADDAGDDGDASIFGFQHRPLLDVDFDEAEPAVGRCAACAI